MHAKIRIAQIVGDDQENVGPILGRTEIQARKEQRRKGRHSNHARDSSHTGDSGQNQSVMDRAADTIISAASAGAA